MALLAVLLTVGSLPAQSVLPDTLLYVYKLHGQTRKYECNFQLSEGSVRLNWRIFRNEAWQTGSYLMPAQSMQSGKTLNLLQPEDTKHITLPDGETFGIVSADALQKLKNQQSFTYSGITYQLKDTDEKAMGYTLLHAVDPKEGGEVWILDCPSLPIIWKMQNNPLEINWTVEPYSNLTRQAASAATGDLKARILQSPEKMGSIYYAYPTPEAVQTAAPEGYTPFYISHYGRHGSRWLTNDERYQTVIAVFDSLAAKGQLTALGKDVQARLHKVWEDAEGRGGQLTPVGERQHHDIALRMYQNFPSVFQGETRINAVSSTSQRCIMSMAAFCESLKEQNPQLHITRATGDRYMRYIAWSSPEVKLHESPQAPWYADYLAFCQTNIRPKRFVGQLFTAPQNLAKPEDIMMGLYWIAQDMQDTTLDIRFYDLFTPEELFGIWQTVNYRMYICNAASPTSQQVGPKSARSLLDDVLGKADAALQQEQPSADLRFGHDTNLIRLLALMQVSGCANLESRPENYYQAWQDFRVSPMGANLQLIFYRNSHGHVLVKLLHNEEEAHLPLSSATAPYYPWEEVKQLWKSSLPLLANGQ